MSFTFTLNEDRRTTKVDTRTNTSYPVPTMTTKDLVGCGNEDYISTSVAASINYRSGCAPSFPALSISLKSLIAKGSTQNYPIVTRFEELAKAIAPVLYSSTGLLDQTVIDRTISGNVPFLSTMREFVSDGKPQGNGRISVLQPSRIQVNDPCGAPSGFSVSSAINVVGFDPSTCQSKLLESVSLKVTLTNTYKGITVPWNFASADDIAIAVFTQSDLNYLEAFTFVDADPLVTNQANLLIEWLANPALGTVVTMGQ